MAENALQQTQQPYIQGKMKGSFKGKECASARFLGYLFWSGERVKELLFFWTVPGRVFLWLCVLTPWYVCWKRKLRGHCQHCTCVFSAAATDDYCRCVCRKCPCFKIVMTHFEMFSRMCVCVRVRVRVRLAQTAPNFENHLWFDL